jgi:hypothetical protein
MDRSLVCVKGKLALPRIQTRLRRAPSLLRSQPTLHRYLECLHKLFATQRAPCVRALTNRCQPGFDFAGREILPPGTGSPMVPPYI